MLILGILTILVVIAIAVGIARQKTYNLGGLFLTVVAGVALLAGIGIICESGSGYPSTRILKKGAVYQVQNVYYSDNHGLAIVKTTGNELLFIEISKYNAGILEAGKYYVASKEKFEGSSYIALKPLPDAGK